MVVVVVEIWGCISQKSPLTSFLRTSCITIIRRGVVVRKPYSLRSNTITYWCTELHLKALPEGVITRLALCRNKIKQQILKIKESVRLWHPWIKDKAL